MADIDSIKGIQPDYNLMKADDMDELLFSAYEQSLGEETRERMKKQIENYEYYEGKQHKDDMGNLIDAEDMERPEGLDYDPTRYETNYFKVIIDRKARWQMSGDHSIKVPKKEIDDPEERVSEGYEPSNEQKNENKRSRDMERLLEKLWKENKMRSKLLQIARDRLIADRVPCKIVYNPSTGKLKWVWRPDYEFVPLYSDDDFEELIGCYFIQGRTEEVDGEEVEAIKMQSYMMFEGESYLHEAIYRTDNLDVLEKLVPGKDDDIKGSAVNIDGKQHMPLGLDFLPVVIFDVDQLVASEIGDGEVSELRVQNDILNMMNEDAIDSLKFEMFSMTALINAPEGTAEEMDIAPGAVIEARGATDSQIPEVKKIESGFRWKEAFKDQYMRVKSTMHEISSLPQIVPQELNFGGLNSDVLRILFHDIIADTEEHWLAWNYAFEELHEKSLRYLQERTSDPAFSYDKDVLRSIEEYDSEMKFVLPLPDNRDDLVRLLTNEISNDLESQAGAMERLGVDNVPAKKKEIENEKMREMMMEDPYPQDEGKEKPDEKPRNEDEDEDEYRYKSSGERVDDNGETEVICPECGGSGEIVSEVSGELITCPTCGGNGWVQERKR